MADLDLTPADGLALLGAAAVAVGTYLPWIVTAPDADVVPQVYLSGMERGIAGVDYVVLGVLVAGLAAAAYYRDDRRGGYLAAGTGALVALLTGYYFAATVGNFLGAFVPGPGAYLTVAGALLLVVAGWRQVRAGGPTGTDEGSGAPA